MGNHEESLEINGSREKQKEITGKPKEIIGNHKKS
jgi:hypothetical protein